jgi:hypothetical protein
VVGTPKGRQPSSDSRKQALAGVTQAQDMIAIYVEILAMDQTIIERVRQLLIKQPRGVDVSAHLSNLRSVLDQLYKVTERIAFWNGRVHSLVKGLL